MPALGWRYSACADDVGIVLADSETHQPLAAALCLRMKLGQDFGANVAYLSRPDFEGRGLSKVAAAVALTTFAEGTQDRIAFVNVQYRDSNQASAGLALRLGLHREPGLDVCVERKGAEPIRLQTCRASLPDVHATCLQILWDAQKTDWAQRLSGACERQQDQFVMETAPCP